MIDPTRQFHVINRLVGSTSPGPIGEIGVGAVGGKVVRFAYECEARSTPHGEPARSIPSDRIHAIGPTRRPHATPRVSNAKVGEHRTKEVAVHRTFLTALCVFLVPMCEAGAVNSGRYILNFRAIELDVRLCTGSSEYICIPLRGRCHAVNQDLSGKRRNASTACFPRRRPSH